MTPCPRPLLSGQVLVLAANLAKLSFVFRLREEYSYFGILSIVFCALQVATEPQPRAPMTRRGKPSRIRPLPSIFLPLRLLSSPLSFSPWRASAGLLKPEALPMSRLRPTVARRQLFLALVALFFFPQKHHLEANDPDGDGAYERLADADEQEETPATSAAPGGAASQHQQEYICPEFKVPPLPPPFCWLISTEEVTWPGETGEARGLCPSLGGEITRAASSCPRADRDLPADFASLSLGAAGPSPSPAGMDGTRKRRCLPGLPPPVSFRVNEAAPNRSSGVGQRKVSGGCGRACRRSRSGEGFPCLPPSSVPPNPAAYHRPPCSRGHAGSGPT